MECLPEECLKEIFNFLSITDRISCRLVCKRWQKSVSFNDVTIVSLLKDLKWSTSSTYLKFPHTCDSCDYFTINCLDGVNLCLQLNFLQTFQKLSTIIFDGSCKLTMVLTENVFHQIQSFSNIINLKRLHFIKLYVEEKCFDQKYSSMANIEDVEFDEVTIIDSNGSMVKNADNMKYWIENLCRTSDKLRILKISNMDSSLNIVSNSLKELQLKKVSQTNEDLNQTCQQCSNLVSIVLNQCYELTDYSCLSHCSQLRTLSLVYCNIVDSDMKNVCSSLKQLERVHIELCPLKDYNMVSMINTLNYLHLGPTAYVTKDALSDIFSKCRITGLKLQAMPLVEPDRLTKLITSYCPKLKFLSLSNIEVANSHLSKIITNCSFLIHLQTVHTKINEEILFYIGTAKNNNVKKFWISEKIREKSVITLALTRLLMCDRRCLDYLKLYVRQNKKIVQKLQKNDDLLKQARLFVTDSHEDFKFL